MHSLKTRLMNLIFPPRCPFCRSVVAESDTVCSACAEKFPIHAHRFALQGEDAFPEMPCVSLFPYDGEVRKAILSFKFYGFRGAARGFGRMMADTVRERAGENPIVTYVPMDAARQRERGYNQAKLLAEAAASYIALPCRPLLKKTRTTAQQHRLTKEQRRKNARGAFAAETEVSGKDIILCDDIVTTGETLRECARVLRKAGAKSVVCVTIAYAGVEIGGKIDYNR